MPKARTTKSGQPLPAFRDDAEERKFWETHEPGDYVGRTRPARVHVSSKVSERVKARSRRLRQKRAG